LLGTDSDGRAVGRDILSFICPGRRGQERILRDSIEIISLLTAVITGGRVGQEILQSIPNEEPGNLNELVLSLDSSNHSFHSKSLWINTLLG
jgi:hypothetical protein